MRRVAVAIAVVLATAGFAPARWHTIREPAPGATADPRRAEAAARTFILAHADRLAPGLSGSDLRTVANQLDGTLRTVTFEQRWHGMRVIGGHLGIVIARDHIFAESTSIWPDVDATVPASAPRGERVVLPVERGGHVTFIVADLVEERSPTTPERWDVYLDGNGRELRRDPIVMSATATLTYNAGIRHANGTRADYPAVKAQIFVNGSPTTTASDGTFSWSGSAPSTVSTSVAGAYVRVVNAAGSTESDMLSVAPAATATWSRASDELVDAQVSTFVYANIAKAKARAIDPTLATWLDTQLDFVVNETNPCNAFSGGNEVHLGRSSDRCENTGRVGDVVMHELGHSFHSHALIPGMGAFESHLSEGLADFFAANITNDPGVGRGIFRTDEPLRQIDPPGVERVFPTDMDFDPHVSGLIIGGALWDLRKALIASLGTAPGILRTEQIFLGIVRRAPDIGSSYMAARIADDDDADLGNGTPNECAIDRAFGLHGLVPGYQGTVVSPPTTERTQDGFVLTLLSSTPAPGACAPLAIAGMTVTWRANDGVPSQFELASADGTTWTATFPPQEPGTVIAYTVDVRFDDGSFLSFPNNPADPRYQLFTGGATPIWCERMDTDPGWDQTTNAGFEWEWASPVPDTGTPDPDAAYSGDHVLGTRMTPPGRYRPNLVVSIATPAVDVSAFETVRLQYRRWLTVEDSQFDKATIEVNDQEVWRNASALNGTLDHVDREWRFHDVDITPQVVDGGARVRWSLVTDFGKELGGWTLDDVCIVGLVKIPRCGDGEVDYNEQCDDGNHVSEDGCDADCIDEVTAGGGGCCSASRDARGSVLLALLVALGLAGQRRRRASSFVPSTSASARMPQ